MVVSARTTDCNDQGLFSHFGRMWLCTWTTMGQRPSPGDNPHWGLHTWLHTLLLVLELKKPLGWRWNFFKEHKEVLSTFFKLQRIYMTYMTEITHTDTSEYSYILEINTLHKEKYFFCIIYAANLCLMRALTGNFCVIGEHVYKYVWKVKPEQKCFKSTLFLMILIYQFYSSLFLYNM